LNLSHWQKNVHDENFLFIIYCVSNQVILELVTLTEECVQSEFPFHNLIIHRMSNLVIPLKLVTLTEERAWWEFPFHNLIIHRMSNLVIPLKLVTLTEERAWWEFPSHNFIAWVIKLFHLNLIHWQKNVHNDPHVHQFSQ
jgi:hypothetical protein